MKKFAILILGFALLGISPSSAIEVSSGMQDIDNHEVATKGKNHAAVWSTYSEDQDLSVMYASAKRGTGDWTPPYVIAAGEGYIYPDVEILDNGKIVVAAVVNHSFVISTTTNSGTQFEEGEIAQGTNAFYFTHPYELELYANGNKLTAVGVVNENGLPEIRTFDLKSNSSNWTSKLVMNGFPTDQLAGCDYEIDVCETNYRLDLSFNKKDQQTIAVIITLDNRVDEELIETYTLFESQRKSLTSNWQSPQLLERYGPADIDGYAFWVTGNVTTPKGKSVLAWTSGFNGQPTRAKIAVSKGFGKEFLQTDSSTLNLGTYSMDPFLYASGEKVTAVFTRTVEGSGDFLITGEVGSMKKAKKSLLDNHWVYRMSKVNGKLTLISVKESEMGPLGIYVSEFKNGNWSLPKKITISTQGDLSPILWNSSIATSSTNILIATSSYNQELDMYGVGLEITTHK